MGCTWGAWCLQLDGCKVGDAGVLKLGVLAAAAAGDGWWQGVDEGARHCRSCSQGAGLDLLLQLLRGCALVVGRPAVLCTGLVTHASCVGGFASCSIASAMLVHLLLLLMNDLQRRVLRTALGCWWCLLLGCEQVVMLLLD